MISRRRLLVPEPPNPLERRQVPASGPLGLKGVLQGYVQELKAAYVSVGPDSMISDFHFLGAVNALGSPAYGGGFGPTAIEPERTFDLFGPGGAVTLDASIVGQVFGEDRVSFATGGYEELSYTVTNAYGGLAGATGQGTAILAYGRQITPPTPADDPSIAGETDYAVTLTFIQVGLMQGFGFATTPAATGTLPVGQTVIEPMTVGDGGASIVSTDPASTNSAFHSLSGPVAITRGSDFLALRGDVELTPADGGDELEITFSVALTEGVTAIGSYTIVGGSGRFEGLIGQGILSLQVLPSEMGLDEYALFFNS